VAEEKREELVAALADIEAVLIRSVAIAATRSPETFLEEAEALDLIIRLRRELQD
jgi:hypothetical protein